MKIDLQATALYYYYIYNYIKNATTTTLERVIQNFNTNLV